MRNKKKEIKSRTKSSLQTNDDVVVTLRFNKNNVHRYSKYSLQTAFRTFFMYDIMLLKNIWWYKK